VKKTLLAILAAAYCSGGVAIAQNSAETFSTYAKRMDAALEQSRDGKCDEAISVLQDGTGSRFYEGQLSAATRSVIQRGILRCAIKNGDRALAEDTFETWRRGAPTDELGWSYGWQVWQSTKWEDPSTAVDLVEAWLEDENAVSDLEIKDIGRVQRAITADTPVEDKIALRIRLFSALEVASYRPTDPLSDMSDIHFPHARALLEAGQNARARQVVGNVTQPSYLLRIHLLNRYEDLRSGIGAPHEFDIQDQYIKQLDRSRSLMKANPDLMQAGLRVAQDYRSLGQNDQALKLLNDILDRHSREAGAYSPYEDVEDYLNWIYNEKAYIQVANGDLEAGIATFRKAIALDETGTGNVSQTINLSSILKYAERYDESAALLEILGDASPFGLMFSKSLKACAAHQQGHFDEVQPYLDYMYEHRTDNYAALQETYACLDDEEAGAALMIERLSDPDHQDRAIMAMQRTLITGRVLPYRVLLRDRLRRVHARADVLAAAEKVGRIIDVPIYDTYWGEI